jgi:hypothetical protein
LEIRSRELERQVERHEVAVEVGVELTCSARRPTSDAITPSGPMGLSTIVLAISSI